MESLTLSTQGNKLKTNQRAVGPQEAGTSAQVKKEQGLQWKQDTQHSTEAQEHSSGDPLQAAAKSLTNLSGIIRL